MQEEESVYQSVLDKISKLVDEAEEELKETSLQSGSERADGVTRYYRGSWQCVNGCRLEDTKK